MSILRVFEKRIAALNTIFRMPQQIGRGGNPPLEGKEAVFH